MRWDLGLGFSVVLLLIAYAVQQFSLEDKNQKFREQALEMEKLKHLIQDNNKVPEAGVFDK